MCKPIEAARMLAIETVKFRADPRMKADAEDARVDGHILDGARAICTLMGHTEAAALLERTADALYGVSISGDIREAYQALLADLVRASEAEA